MSQYVSREIVARLLETQRYAASHLDRIRNFSGLHKDLVTECIYEFIFARLMLGRDEVDTDILDELIELSVNRSLKIGGDSIKQPLRAGGCDPKSPVSTRRVLIFLSIQRELSIKLPADRAAQLITVENLASLVWRAINDEKSHKQH